MMSSQVSLKELIVYHQKSRDPVRIQRLFVAWEVPDVQLGYQWYLAALEVQEHLQTDRVRVLLWVVEPEADRKLKRYAGFALLLPFPEQCSGAG